MKTPEGPVLPAGGFDSVENRLRERTFGVDSEGYVQGDKRDAVFDSPPGSYANGTTFYRSQLDIDAANAIHSLGVALASQIEITNAERERAERLEAAIAWWPDANKTPAMYAKGKAEGAESCRAAGGHGEAVPVAWMRSHPNVNRGERFTAELTLTANDFAAGWTQTPLYEHPSIAVGEAVAWRYVGRDGWKGNWSDISHSLNAEAQLNVEYAYTHPAKAVEVTEEMVERAMAEYQRVKYSRPRATKDAIRAALNAAMAGRKG
jgi:hypothetical protein